MLNYRSLFTFPLLALALPMAKASAQPIYKSLTPADFKVPQADLEKWAQRLKKLCPSEGWTVSIENNDILIARDKPVRFRQMEFNQPPRTKGEQRPQGPSYEKTYRLRLRFAPLMSPDKYDELEAQNKRTDSEDLALQAKHNVTARFGIIFDYTDEQRAKKQAYEAEAKKLVFYRLPNFYCPDYSLTLYQSWRWQYFLDSGDKSIDRECNDVKAAVAKYFGNYSYLVATNNSAFGFGEELADETLSEEKN